MTAERRRLVGAEIRLLMDEKENAVRARNVDAAMSNCAPDVVTFDVVGGLQRVRCRLMPGVLKRNLISSRKD